MAEMVVNDGLTDENIVWMRAQTAKTVFFRGTLKECEELCSLYEWELTDENQFVWSLEIE